MSRGTDDSCVGLFPVLYCMNFIGLINVVRFSLSQGKGSLNSWTYIWRQNFCYFRFESLVYEGICKRIQCSFKRKRRVYYATRQRKVLVKVKAFKEVKYYISRRYLDNLPQRQFSPDDLPPVFGRYKVRVRVQVMSVHWGQIVRRLGVNPLGRIVFGASCLTFTYTERLQPYASSENKL